MATNFVLKPIIFVKGINQKKVSLSQIFFQKMPGIWDTLLYNIHDQLYWFFSTVFWCMV